MKILLPLLLLPLLAQSQSIKVDTTGLGTDSIIVGDIKILGNSTYRFIPEPKLYRLPEIDSLPSDLTTGQNLRYYGGSNWYNNWSTELVKGKVETPINVMDSGMKVEVVETRDTIYKCPMSYGSVTYFTSTGEIEKITKDLTGCTLDKIVTTRRYKLYILNEYGQKEYLSMELTKEK